MALGDEHADILGGPILQRPESGLLAACSRYRIVLKSAMLLGLGLLVWIVCARGLEHLTKHRERRYKKAMRRKHGIPDSDCRPFTVAYAAAKRTHLEREAQDRKKTTNHVSDHNLPDVDQRTDAKKDMRGLRRRVPETAFALRVAVQPRDIQFTANAYDNKGSGAPFDIVDRINPNPGCPAGIPQRSPADWHPVHPATRKVIVTDVEHNEESRKRSFEDERDVEREIMKRSRIDREELKGGDNQVDWYAQYNELPPSESLNRQPAGNCVHMNGQERSKRINDFQNEDREPADEVMEGIDQDEVTELQAVARGKKRDRAEAGSSFGGDDDDDIRNGRPVHHRKRRTVLRTRVEVPARGQKRDREAESEGEEGGSETHQRRGSRFRRKRGKKATSDQTNEISVEDPRLSKDSLCNGRRVGDEWEANGIQYKVGSKGERLRLALVKKAKNKYHMPQDSQHPDRSAALEIYVETWMTDEQYKYAEERQELAWQETPREPSESGAPGVVNSSPKKGKNLLWDSVRVSPVRRSSRQFIPVGALTRINPFERLQPVLGRRVASSSVTVSPVLLDVADSPIRPGFRGFSKWEKQDREAEALAKIRAKIEEQKEAQVPPRKPAEVPTSVSAPTLGSRLLSVPTITLTPAPIITADGLANNASILQSKPNTLFPAAPSGNDTTKSAAAAVPAAIGFSLPSTSTPVAAPSPLLPSVLTAPTTASLTSSVSPFSFDRPSQVPLSTSATSSSTVSNPFEKVETASTSVRSPSALGATDRPQPPATEDTSKPEPSTPAMPDTSTFTSSAPAAFPTAKYQASSIGACPSSVTFDSTPAVAKAEVPVPSPASTSTATSDNLKPAPPFSFSSTATHQALPVPKFSFGQPHTTSAFMPSCNLTSGATSQSKPTFKFGQAPPGAKDGDPAPTFRTAEGAKKPPATVSAFGATTSSNGSLKHSSFQTVPPLGDSTPSSPSVLPAHFTVKPTTDSSTSTFTFSKPTLAPTSTTTINNIFSSTPTETCTSTNTPVFTFGGMNPVSKPGGGLKPSSLLVGAVGSPNPVPTIGGNSAEKKPTFTFAASTGGPKPIIFGGNTEGLKPPVFGGSAGSSARSRGGM